MKIKILFFASAREKVGESQIIVDIDSTEVTLGDLIRLLYLRYPSLNLIQTNGEFAKEINFAVNKKYSFDYSLQIHENDEIALIPPISGG
jgi:MoaD family protein